MTGAVAALPIRDRSATGYALLAGIVLATLTEAIAGTVVSFEMTPVPGGSATIDGQSIDVKPFFIGRTEVTWDLYDVFALGLDTPRGASSADAVARPSQPYSAPDYGWGHAGSPAISIARPAAEAFTVWLANKTGKKYLEFHQKLLGGRGEANKARALAVAKEIGLDMGRLDKDMASPEVKATLQESFKLAEALGLNGTPSYVIGDNVVVGAVGLEALREKVSTSRCGKPSC